MEQTIIMGVSVIISVVVFIAMNLAAWFICKDVRESKYLGTVEKSVSYLILSIIGVVDVGGVAIVVLQLAKAGGLL